MTTIDGVVLKEEGTDLWIGVKSNYAQQQKCFTLTNYIELKH